MSTAEPVSVTIKPLEWKEASLSSNRSDRFTADSIVGQYEVLEWSDGTFGGTLPGKTDEPGVEFTAYTMDEAKAAAQADYEKRILATLSHVQAHAPVAAQSRDDVVRECIAVVEKTGPDRLDGLVNRENVITALRAISGDTSNG